MAVRRSLVVLAIVAAMAPAIAFATQFMVGDDAGWKLGVDYNVWASGKRFVVGDSLVFKYAAANHSVYKVNETDFQNCTVPQNHSLGLFTGNDIINLATTGKKWYICGTIGHCGQGQKLNITVESASAPSRVSIFQILLGIILAIAAMVMVN